MLAQEIVIHLPVDLVEIIDRQVHQLRLEDIHAQLKKKYNDPLELIHECVFRKHADASLTDDIFCLIFERMKVFHPHIQFYMDSWVHVHRVVMLMNPRHVMFFNYDESHEQLYVADAEIDEKGIMTILKEHHSCRCNIDSMVEVLLAKARAIMQDTLTFITGQMHTLNPKDVNVLKATYTKSDILKLLIWFNSLKRFDMNRNKTCDCLWYLI